MDPSDLIAQLVAQARVPGAMLGRSTGTLAPPASQEAGAGDIAYIRAHMVRQEDGEGEPGDPIEFVAATEGKKADGLNLKMDGVELDRFRSNPVILWAHNYWSVPIGRAVDVHVDGDQLIEKIVFDQDDEEATRVERKYRAGYLNAVSIGFNPKIVVDPDTGEAVPWWKGGDVTLWELLETSAVPVPMDPDALKKSARGALWDVLAGVDATQLAAATAEERKGAVLSARNREALEKARDLIAGVLDAATKEEEEDDGDDDRAADVTAEAFAMKVLEGLG